MATTTVAELQSVADLKARLIALLRIAEQAKAAPSVDPPLPFAPIILEVDRLHEGVAEQYDLNYRFVAIETAAREIFYACIQTISIEEPAFVQVWNFLDILMLCGDRGQCTAELVCYLIEELLDSQTTTGCRIVFNFLESRRERLAAKDFHKKNLVFLRACNELLRRLSRAEDAIFCGRVFFFLFQTFPLGDKSSVNLRGEFHTENVTKFELASDDVASGADMGVEPAELDNEHKAPTHQRRSKAQDGSSKESLKSVEEAPPLPADQLYPIFWRLQQDFCDPTRLFQNENFDVFKEGLTKTLKKFKATPPVVQTHVAEDDKRGTKRKASEMQMKASPNDHFANNYNPKYLTSPELFDLELSDLAFQRHIMVQALILIDFLLSLTEKAKKKLVGLEAHNKSMLYGFTLEEDNMKWANSMRIAITTYIQSFGDGRFYCRMIETVLARDKNWVRWKIESCPSIVREPVSTSQELKAREDARDFTRPRKVPERPAGAMDLSFLREGSGGGLEALKDPSRYTAPTIQDLIRESEADRLDLDFAVGEEVDAIESKISNKMWRALREARAVDLAILEKVEPGKDIKDVFAVRSGEVVGAENQVVDDDADQALESQVEVAEIDQDGHEISVKDPEESELAITES